MRAKVILVGNAGVGKTAILNRFIERSFEDNYNPSISLSYVSKMIANNGDEVQLNIWDTAGQEQYKSISKLYLRDSNVALICFYYEDQKSMDDIDEWVNFVKDASPNCILYLVSTKEDLIDDFSSVNNFIKSKEDNTFAKVFRTSAKNGFGIDEIFMSAINEQFNTINTENNRSLESYENKNIYNECC